MGTVTSALCRLDRETVARSCCAVLHEKGATYPSLSMERIKVRSIRLMKIEVIHPRYHPNPILGVAHHRYHHHHQLHHHQTELRDDVKPQLLRHCAAPLV